MRARILLVSNKAGYRDAVDLLWWRLSLRLILHLFTWLSYRQHHGLIEFGASIRGSPYSTVRQVAVSDRLYDNFIRAPSLIYFWLQLRLFMMPISFTGVPLGTPMTTKYIIRRDGPLVFQMWVPTNTKLSFFSDRSPAFRRKWLQP